MALMEKTTPPADIEGRISRLWEESGAFKAGRPERRGAKPFTIVIPPPNVTGSLHMGHALNVTLQDILARFERLRRARERRRHRQSAEAARRFLRLVA